jgi:hypothetical protein
MMAKYLSSHSHVQVGGQLPQGYRGSNGHPQSRFGVLRSTGARYGAGALITTLTFSRQIGCQLPDLYPMVSLPVYHCPRHIDRIIAKSCYHSGRLILAGDRSNKSAHRTEKDSSSGAHAPILVLSRLQLFRRSVFLPLQTVNVVGVDHEIGFPRQPFSQR